MKRGMTLIEVLIAAVLLVLLVVMVLEFTVTSKRYYMAGVAAVTEREELQIALARLRRDVQDSSVTSFTVSADAVSMVSFVDGAGVFQPGTPQKYIVYYVPAGQSILYRKESPAPTPTPLTAAQLTEVMAAGGGIQVAHGVQRFEVQRTSQQVSVTLQLPTSAMTATMWVRNQAR